jgi:hypothetical protein
VGRVLGPGAAARRAGALLALGVRRGSALLCAAVPWAAVRLPAPQKGGGAEPACGESPRPTLFPLPLRAAPQGGFAYLPTSKLPGGADMNLGIELDCAFGVVDGWANAGDLGFPRTPEEDRRGGGGGFGGDDGDDDGGVYRRGGAAGRPQRS